MSHPFFIAYKSEAAETAAEAATKAAAEAAAKVAAHHHEVTAAEAAHVHLANLAALGKCEESRINILGNEVLCGLACGSPVALSYG